LVEHKVGGIGERGAIPKEEEVVRLWKQLNTEKIRDLIYSLNVNVIKSRRALRMYTDMRNI